eukprot:6236802-Amphidinium_carterae.2
MTCACVRACVRMSRVRTWVCAGLSFAVCLIPAQLGAMLSTCVGKQGGDDRTQRLLASMQSSALQAMRPNQDGLFEF